CLDAAVFRRHALARRTEVREGKAGGDARVAPGSRAAWRTGIGGVRCVEGEAYGEPLETFLLLVHTFLSLALVHIADRRDASFALGDPCLAFEIGEPELPLERPRSLEQNARDVLYLRSRGLGAAARLSARRPTANTLRMPFGAWQTRSFK